MKKKGDLIVIFLIDSKNVIRLKAFVKNIFVLLRKKKALVIVLALLSLFGYSSKDVIGKKITEMQSFNQAMLKKDAFVSERELKASDFLIEPNKFKIEYLSYIHGDLNYMKGGSSHRVSLVSSVPIPKDFKLNLSIIVTQADGVYRNYDYQCGAFNWIDSRGKVIPFRFKKNEPIYYNESLSYSDFGEYRGLFIASLISKCDDLYKITIEGSYSGGVSPNNLSIKARETLNWPEHYIEKNKKLRNEAR